MSTSPGKSAKPSTSSSVHQKLSMLASSSSSGKPFIKSKSQTTSSIVFPSFRFSPESEEIEEIRGTAEEEKDEERRASFGGSDAERSVTPPLQSTSSDSAAKSGGDISPLKEYILKHKWANKWEKRSLSLDLDLKGKIITAIEDKRRSFVSHFYNEEEEEILRDGDAATPSMITSSTSIPEQLVATTSNLLETDTEEISVHSDSLLTRGNKHHFPKFNFDEENNSDYFDEFELGSSSLPNTPITNLMPDDLKDLIVEEIGVDCCEDTSMVGGDGKVNLSLLREFVLPPDSLQELFSGLPTLYNTPCAIGDLRKLPIQEVASPPDIVEEKQDPALYRSLEPEQDPASIKSVIKKVLWDIFYHPWVKYWIGMIAVLILLDLGTFVDRLIWFGLGMTLVIIVNEALSKPEEKPREPDSVSASAVDVAANIYLGSIGKSNYWKSQGWMLTLAPADTSIQFPEYDPFEFHLKNTKNVFIRLDGPFLLMSFPHPKHRISKRRLWSDPMISSEMIFVKHQHYNLYGAKIEVVPSGLARKRVWCKKYPIAITLACSERYLGKLTEGSGGDISPSDKDSKGKEEEGVSFSKDDKGNPSVRMKQHETLHGEVYKEDDCAGRTFYLFAKTDREKDDWFRRLVAASKHHTTRYSADTDFEILAYADFIAYMKRICPGLHVSSVSPPSTTPKNELFENVTFHHQPTSNQNSPSSSRKSTPDKEMSIINNPDLLCPSFLNAVLARLFHDFLRSPRWTHQVKVLIDRKLFFLRKPKVVESLKVKELDLGNTLPVILHASSPVLDRQGLWVDLDISFTGTIVITIEAFVNLFNMGKSTDTDTTKAEAGSHRPSPSRSPASNHAMFDNDADDSGESSETDEELDLEIETKEPDNRGKMMKYADALAKSSVMRNKHVKKVVTNIATTPIVLTVEINEVKGNLAINFPPVPNNRVWVGFRANPKVEINARPKFGERVLSFSQITGWIKRKILLEFQRVMVIPNMVDITVPIMEFDLPK